MVSFTLRTPLGCMSYLIVKESIWASAAYAWVGTTRAQARAVKTIKKERDRHLNESADSVVDALGGGRVQLHGRTQLTVFVIDEASCRPHARARSISPSSSGPSTSST
jgi:hypothetical protein